MGNNQCAQLCQQTKTEVIKPVDYNPQMIPQLSKEINIVLENKKPFSAELAAEHQIATKRYGGDVYEGPVDFVNRPQGYGKMYKNDGSIIISHFKEGKAIGPSICVFPDGSYYEGKLLNNIAQDQQGKFQNKQMIYFGSFKNNLFDGEGHQEGHNYQFDGTFQKGRRKSGKLTWKAQDGAYTYQGLFNENSQFQGDAILSEPKGLYKGSFVKGKKSGKGVYEYKSGIIYDGHYQKDYKQGLGTIYNNDGCIAYSGQFKHGLPNGKGVVYNQRNQKIQGQFRDGIDILLLDDNKAQAASLSKK